MRVYTILRNLVQGIKNALQEAKEYTDSKQKTGTFYVKCPRLNNQTITFNYVQYGDRLIVANAHITANASSDSGRLYLYFADPTTQNVPFYPSYVFGAVSCNDVEYPAHSSYSNNNLWLGGLRGNVASGKKVDISLILMGGVTHKIIGFIASLLGRRVVMA